MYLSTYQAAKRIGEHCVERFRDVDDWTLNLMVNEFVFAQGRTGWFGFFILGKMQDT